MHETPTLVEFIEYVLGFSNALLGMAMALYVAKTFRRKITGDSEKLLAFVKSTLFAIIFLSAFSLFHFIREVFELKDKYGPVVEYPEYIAIFIVFIILLWQIISFDAPDDFFK